MGKQRRTNTSRAPSHPPGEFLTAAEAARQLGVTPSTLRRWIHTGRVPAQRAGKKWRIRPVDLAGVVEVPTASPAPTPVSPDVTEEAEACLDALLERAGPGSPDTLQMVEQIETSLAGRLAGSDPAVRRLLAKLLLGAVRSMASDLHIEPAADRVRVRQRTDGLLMEIAALPKDMAGPLTTEIMRWAQIDPAVRRLPQDGRFLVEFGGREIDARVSTMPSVHGTVVALRVLDRQVMLPELDALGFEPEQFDRYRDLIHSPNGLILLSGPTGSGKTTTIYRSLSQLNTPDRKIMTAEDPVEYPFDGMDQAAIDESIGFDFERALISMLRQAPNIMFIGEIRTGRTAQLLCQAALTGHLVFSVLHAPDSLAGVRRLLETGIPPALLGGALRCVVAQRLVRLVCPHCKTEHQPTAEELRLLGAEEGAAGSVFYQGQGCERCNLTGYRGRTAIYELLDFTEDMRSAVATYQGDPRQLVDAARRTGYRSLREVALAKLARGETTVEEVCRETCVPDRAQMI